jgi:hypothetical protein
LVAYVFSCIARMLGRFGVTGHIISSSPGIWEFCTFFCFFFSLLLHIRSPAHLYLSFSSICIIPPCIFFSRTVQFVSFRSQGLNRKQGMHRRTHKAYLAKESQFIINWLNHELIIFVWNGERPRVSVCLLICAFPCIPFPQK